MARIKAFGTLMGAVVLLSCGLPLGPGSATWYVLADLDVFFATDYMEVATDRDAAFFPYRISWGNPNGGIKKYENGTLVDAYVPDLKGACSASVVNLAIGPKSGWAIGAREYIPRTGTEIFYAPFLVKYGEGRWAGETEYPVDLGPDDFPMGIVPAEADSCYLLGAGFTANVPRKLYKFENGVVTAIPAVEANAVAYDAGTATTYALAGKGDRIDVMVSTDGGSSWTTETLTAAPPVNGFTTGYIYAAVGGDGVLYVCARTSNPMGTVVYRRTGAVGSGQYEMCGYYPVGPYAGRYVYGLAVDGRGHVLIVGEKTSICYDGSEWREEELPDKNSFFTVAGGNSGFYAIAINGMPSADTELLYHP